MERQLAVCATVNRRARAEDGSARNKLSEAVLHLMRATELDPWLNTRKMHATISAMHGLCAAIECARASLAERDIEEIVRPAWELHSRSPFVKRLQTWPRGYPGDFFAIEQICTARVSIPQTHPCYWIEWYALNSAIAQQHRNKIAFQRKMIFDGLKSGASVASVGCGGARDFLDAPSIIEATTVFLIDKDQAALDLAFSRVAPMAKSTIGVCRDAVRGLRQVSRAKLERIVFGGLFDYLSDRSVVLLLRLATRCLAPDSGAIVFTNLSTNSHFGVWSETMARWRLIARTKEQLMGMIADAAIIPSRVEIGLDETGLSFLATIRT